MYLQIDKSNRLMQNNHLKRLHLYIKRIRLRNNCKLNNVHIKHPITRERQKVQITIKVAFANQTSI